MKSFQRKVNVWDLVLRRRQQAIAELTVVSLEKLLTVGGDIPNCIHISHMNDFDLDKCLTLGNGRSYLTINVDLLMKPASFERHKPPNISPKMILFS